MANGEEGNGNGQNQNRDLGQELKAAQQKLETAQEGLSRIRTAYEKAVEREKIAKNDAEKARNLEESAKRRAKKARTDRTAAIKREAEAIRRESVAVQRAKDAEDEAKGAKGREKAANEREKAANEELNEQTLADKLFEDAKAARRGLRDFVGDALTDILLGVDDAATHAVSRKLTDGLSESGLVSPSSIGNRPGTNRESLVEFDLAVMAGEQHADSSQTGTGASLKFSLMKVLPLGLSGEAGWHRKKTSEDRTEVSHHNRIRFSVPVVFARGDDSLE